MTSKLPSKITIGYIGMQGCFRNSYYARFQRINVAQLPFAPRYPICVRDCEAVNDKLQERELKQQTSRFSENVNPQCPQRSHHPHLHQAHQPHCHDQSLQQAQHHHHHPHTSRHHYPHHHTAPPHLPH